MGVSKHYVLKAGGDQYYDYQIPKVLRDYIPYYVADGNMAFGLKNLLTEMDNAKTSWRKKIRDMWLHKAAMRPGHEMLLIEFSVYPRRKPNLCSWRAIVGGMRAAPNPKKKLEFFRYNPVPLGGARAPRIPPEANPDFVIQPRFRRVEEAAAPPNPEVVFPEGWVLDEIPQPPANNDWGVEAILPRAWGQDVRIQ